MLQKFHLKRSISLPINSGTFLIIAAVLALLVANSPWSDAYNALWQHEIVFRIGNFNFFNHGGHPLTLMSFINDALMTIFFFVVGLEIKREILVGELSSIKKALLPIVAACGGMIFPVLIYYFITRGTPAESGLAIPMATDIAFSLGVLSLFGNRVPLSLKVFLTAFAVVDDIGGIFVIALFYTSHLDVTYILYSFMVLFFLLMCNVMKVRNKWAYILPGIIMWYCFMQCGIHATISGVVVAFAIPAVPRVKIGSYISHIHESVDKIPEPDSECIILSHSQIHALNKIKSASDKAISPLQSLEDSLSSFVSNFIMPLFAFANAGVVLTASHGGMEIGQITWAVMLGLIFGKFIGIYLFTWLVVKLGFASLGKGMTWKNLTGICMLGGIGFTVSLFIANLSFGNEVHLLNEAKMGVLFGTVIAGFLGYAILDRTLSKENSKCSCN